MSIQQTQAQENALDLVQPTQTVQAEKPKPEIEISDAKLWKAYENLRAWSRQSHPQPPLEEEQSQLQQQLSEYRQRFEVLDLTVERQRNDLEQLGEPRSLFNWKGPSQAEVEARRQLIQENVERSNGVKRKYNQSVQQLKQWQAKDQAFEEWRRSPLTQQMKQATQYFKQPEIQERIEQIVEGAEWFQLSQKLLEQAGKREGNMRRIRGQTYLLESDGQSVLIMRNDKPIFHASDERKKGGIVKTHKMAMTEDDWRAIRKFSEKVQERLRQQQRRSQSRGISL